MTPYIDIHCHCLPAVDDGPITMAESLLMCHTLVDDGATNVIATPHQLGRFNDCNHAPQIREAVTILNEQLKISGINLNVVPGADVRVDERICQLIEADKVLTLADGRKYLLLELPHQVFINIKPLIADLLSMGISPVISHPERHPVLVKKPQILSEWLQHSAYVQITSGSLLGKLGPTAKNASWDFLTSGLVSLVATDSHNLNSRRPCMNAAFQNITARLGEKIANLVCIENPLRILKGQELLVCPASTMEHSDGKIAVSC